MTITPFAEATPALDLSDDLLRALHALGFREAFGLVGGAIAPFCDRLARSSLRSYQVRHEGGALFAAVEASLATGRPTLAFVTTGPGLLNALNGAVAARWEGARVLLISGATSLPQRGRWAVQETSPATLPGAAVYQAGSIFQLATLLDAPAALPAFLGDLAEGLRRPEGFVAHLGLPINVQRSGGGGMDIPALLQRSGPPLRPCPSAEEVDEAARQLARAPFAIWVGHGARAASETIVRLAERCGAPVVCTPRGKGAFSETHPLYLGVTGCGGHEQVEPALARLGIQRMLVLGSKLGEFSSCWAEGLAPPGGFVHVDLDPAVFGAAYPQVETLGLVGDVGAVVSMLTARLPPGAWPSLDGPTPPRGLSRGPILPQELLAAVQEVIIEGSDATVLAESGNAFLWANHLLTVAQPGRYRVSGLWGSMGHATSGVIGLAAVGGPAVALVGDGAMLMMNEVSTAVQYGLPAVWIVLNDARMGIVEKGMAGLGLRPYETDLPATDFAGMAHAMGARGIRVDRARDLAAALRQALDGPGPVVVDVLIDPDEPSPFARRVSTLNAMGARSSSGTRA